MNVEKVEKEMTDIISNLDSEDERTAEYTKMVMTVSKLQDIELKQKDFENRQKKNDFEEDLRTKQFDLSRKQFKFEKEKAETQFNLDTAKMSYQHEERMAEIEVNKIKAENEKEILKQNQQKAERQFKETKRKDILVFCAKALGLITIVGINVLMHKDELRFERDENGIIPQRCKTYDAVVGRLSENVMR